jgi:HSP20 family protein
MRTHAAAAENGALTSAWLPACDVFEDSDAVKIVAEVPGVRPEDIKLSIENNLLTIRPEKNQQAEENGERVHRYERSYGTFERTFVLPTTVDPERIDARSANGIAPERRPPRQALQRSRVRFGQGRGGAG